MKPFPVSFMKLLDAPALQSRKQQFLLILAFLILSGLCYSCLVSLNEYETPGRVSTGILAAIQFLFFISTILAWVGFRGLAIAFFAPTACLFSILTSWVTHDVKFLFYVPSQAMLCFLLFRFDEEKNAELMVHNVEIEKAINQKNDMELAFKEEGTGISVSFEKYTSYYNLRNLANDFSTTLALKDLSQMIVSKTTELIPQTQGCLLYLADPESGGLSLVASKRTTGEAKSKVKSGGVFDYWVLRNRQSLIISDTQKDFRFDLRKISEEEEVRSLIASPLVHEGKGVGTLRLNAEGPKQFTTDHLRLLDAVSTLASAAISNSILFQKTEELAIRDSLTGLYVQRYFLERLSEEHRRSLLTNSPLSLLMCDLDHFKSCNDRYGHGIGDYVLVQTAQILGRTATEGIVARYGGEEFSILLPKFTIKQARVMAESIRAQIAGMNLNVRREVIPVALSIGVASVPTDTLDSEELIRIADGRLYEAKRSGRNRVCGGE